MDETAGLLEGLRVVEVSAFVAAPLGGAQLARMGAEVIRIDPLGGQVDAGRWPLHQGRSLYWAGLNRGKRTVALDLRQERGLELAARLAARAGNLLTNLPPRSPLAHPDLSRRNPDQVTVQIVGHRDGGAAVDYTVNAMTGFPWITGPADATGPVNHVLPAWDVATGYLAAAAVLAADRSRSAGRGGRLVTLSLADVALQVADHLGLVDEARLMEEPRGRYGNQVYGTFGTDLRSADGRWLMLLALTSRQWRALVEATGIEVGDLPGDLRREGVRWQHRQALTARLRAWAASLPFAEVRARLEAAGCLWGPFRTFKELVRDDPRVGPLVAARAPDPVLGQDTEAVLAELGEDPDRLRVEGVIAS
jgi:2-methylfumaryl-CoA isomerase